MTLAKDKKRAYVALANEQQKALENLKNKYQISGGKILSIALDLLAEQEKAGFEIPALGTNGK
ncbi:hypothetical protein [Enterococcus sp. DIV0240a]|uniref:hypothetical protein n=1 Tax=Enterococcus sp. DIV0240a TaxID=2774651 RepID=UPI003D27751D